MPTRDDLLRHFCKMSLTVGIRGCTLLSLMNSWCVITYSVDTGTKHPARLHWSCTKGALHKYAHHSFQILVWFVVVLCKDAHHLCMCFAMRLNMQNWANNKCSGNGILPCSHDCSLCPLTYWYAVVCLINSLPKVRTRMGLTSVKKVQKSEQQDQHQCKSEWEEESTCSYDHHHYHWPHQDRPAQHDAAINDTCMMSCQAIVCPKLQVALIAYINVLCLSWSGLTDHKI